MQTNQDIEEKVKLLKEAKEKLLNKDNTIYYFLTEAETESAAIYEIYLHAKTLKDDGYNVKILTDINDYKHPKFLDEDLKVFESINIAKKADITIGPSDYLIIPELFSNIMQQIQKLNLPCAKIVLFQSYVNAFKGLLPAMTWKDFGINNIMTTSKRAIGYLKEYFGKNYDIQSWDIGIPDYFKAPTKPKKNIITFFSRNPKEVEMVIKSFYAKYPHLRFITFQEARNFTREELSETLQDSIALLWLDRHAMHGTLPLEAMKCGTLPIGLIPELKHKDDDWYINEKTGVWLNSTLEIPEFLSKIVMTHIQSDLPKEVIEGMSDIVKKYNMKDSKLTITNAYNFFFTKRIKEFEGFIESNEKLLAESNKKEQTDKK